MTEPLELETCKPAPAVLVALVLVILLLALTVLGDRITRLERRVSDLEGCGFAGSIEVIRGHSPPGSVEADELEGESWQAVPRRGFE